MYQSKRHRRKNRGQGLAEMAVVLPLMLVCLCGVIEMGRLFFAWVTVQHAARVGARTAVTGQGEQNGTRLTLIINATQQAASSLGGSPNVTVRSWPDVSASGPGRDDDPGRPCELVEVEVQVLYQPVIPLIGNVMPGNGQMLLEGRDRKLNEPWIPCP